MIGYGMENKRGVISGGTSGIGLAAARLLVQDGAAVYLVGRDPERGRKAVESLAGLPGEARYIQGDVSTAEGCRKIAASLQEQHLELDFLVNSAGIYLEKPFQDVTEEEYRQLMDVNVKGTIFLTQALLDLFAQDGPSIVNIASDAALEGNYGCCFQRSRGGFYEIPGPGPGALDPGELPVPRRRGYASGGKTAGGRGIFPGIHGVRLSYGADRETGRSGPHDLCCPVSYERFHDWSHRFRGRRPDSQIRRGPWIIN